MQKILMLVRQIIIKIREKGWRETFAIALRKGASTLTQSQLETPSQKNGVFPLASLPLDYEIILMGLMLKSKFSIQSKYKKYKLNLSILW